MMNKPKIHIAFLGPQGSYSHIATMIYANHYSNNQIIEYSCQNFKDIFDLVKYYQAEYGVLPIENSNSGLIEEVCDLLLNTPLILTGDITIPIQHRILVSTNTSLNKIQIIYSHPQPVQQCSKFLKHFPKWKIIFCKSSAIAIKKVANLKQTNLAALGSTQGGQFYGLKPLIPHQIISNYYENNTRFIILKNTNLLIPNTATSTKIMITMSINSNHKKLFLILKILQHYNIKISFLRLRRLIDYNKDTIILEIIAYFHDFYTQQALINIKKNTYSLKILGYYSSF